MKLLTKLDRSWVLEYYRQMLLIRRFEQESARQYMQGKIGGFLHLYIGEEANAVGAISAIEPDDYVISHYRDHGHALARGMEPRVVMAELMGKVTGSSAGKGGSMHLFDASRLFMGGYAIVGGQLPIAVGLALACKHRGESRAVLCFLGDGAVNEGEFHESMNLASLWRLPVLFFLENNLYGMGTHIDRTHAGGRDIYQSAEAYGIPAAQIDGMDILEVREATLEARERIRSAGGPVFVESRTYRFQGHSMADPSEYRQQAEVDEWMLKDPIERLKTHSREEGLMGPEDISRIEAEVKTVVEEAVRFAEESDDPETESLYENVYG